MKKIILLLPVFITTNLFSQDWKEILASDNHKYYYKPSTEKTAWIKDVSEQTEYYPANNNKKIIDGYKIILYKFDCSEKQIGVLQMTTYSKSGKVLNTTRINEYLVQMDYVIPDSIGEGILDSFCHD
ncbi:mRNA deadenylase 3'-5' endonuclease subunit Ccr4 [Chryseobacterium sp. SLBN-27]|uniref:surface-adhesin E family protein n=1 Tax=Chryseobacterium sp. SLBN-27 TaxID=3042287 RepID=UPI002857586C|nr:surface-adhesin E family protein [Chryseobacterium sp. SLBN-27]MDR6157027.1 mRNA deadenylase 3'-5' endonuclease subunit Ccr4 [Chryseobacterium sp. SLBN-27]